MAFGITSDLHLIANYSSSSNIIILSIQRLDYNMNVEHSFYQESFCNYSLLYVQCKICSIIFEVELTLNCSQIKVKSAKVTLRISKWQATDIESSRLRGFDIHFSIKLRDSNYRVDGGDTWIELSIFIHLASIG